MPETRKWAVPRKYVVSAEANATDDIVEHAARHPEQAEGPGVMRARGPDLDASDEGRLRHGCSGER